MPSFGALRFPADRLLPRIARTPRRRSSQHPAVAVSAAEAKNRNGIAVAKNLAVAAWLARESIAVPLSPLSEVQPPASFAPYPMSMPVASRIGPPSVRPGPVKVAVSHR